MEFTAEQIAGLLQGEVDGNPSASVNGLAKIEEGNDGSLSFLSNPKYEEKLFVAKLISNPRICQIGKNIGKILSQISRLIRKHIRYL